MHRAGVSAPDIAGADKSNPPPPESFRSQWPNLNLRMAYFGQCQTPREEWPVLGLRVAYFDGQYPFFRVISQTDPLPTCVGEALSGVGETRFCIGETKKGEKGQRLLPKWAEIKKLNLEGHISFCASGLRCGYFSRADYRASQIKILIRCCIGRGTSDVIHPPAKIKRA